MQCGSCNVCRLLLLGLANQQWWENQSQNRSHNRGFSAKTEPKLTEYEKSKTVTMLTYRWVLTGTAYYSENCSSDKLAVQTFKIWHTSAAAYLRRHITACSGTRSLRSSTVRFLDGLFRRTNIGNWSVKLQCSTNVRLLLLFSVPIFKNNSTPNTEWPKHDGTHGGPPQNINGHNHSGTTGGIQMGLQSAASSVP